MSDPQTLPRHQGRLFDVDQRAMLVDELGFDVLAELQASFWVDCARLTARAVTALERHHRADLEETVHTIKGAAANLGLAGIVAAATRLRQALRAGEWPDLADLEAQMTLTRAALSDDAGG